MLQFNKIVVLTSCENRLPQPNIECQIIDKLQYPRLAIMNNNDRLHTETTTMKSMQTSIKRILIRHPCMQLEPTLNLLLEQLDVCFAVTGSDRVCPIINYCNYKKYHISIILHLAVCCA